MFSLTDKNVAKYAVSIANASQRTESGKQKINTFVKKSITQAT